MSRRDFEAATGVSRETLERLDGYASLLFKWNRTINLMGRSTIDDVWTRHFLDSAQLQPLIKESETNWVDIGSGGGFPGLVLAILNNDRPIRFTLVESDQRKASFLRIAAFESGVDVRIVNRRAEEIEPLEATSISARALAPLPRLLDLSVRHLKSSGQALFLKGKNWKPEVAQALDKWSFSQECHPSLTDPDAVVLVLKDFSRV